jgi:4-amino-4-deoxy-L-arabinose transferase-like glycosyltransferase
LGGDSYYYVSGARGLLNGQGFVRPAADGSFRPITHFPPLYSLLLAAASGIGGEILPTARVVHAVLFGLNVALAGWLVWRGTRSLWLAAIGALFIGVSPAMVSVHSWLLSEALFLCLTLSSVACLISYLERGGRIALVGAGLAAGLAVLTRYAGVALVLAGAALLVGWPGRSRSRRLGDVGLFLALALFGWLAWAGRNAMLVGSVTNRALSLHLPGATKLGEAVTTIARWLLPGRVPAVVGGVAALILAVWLLVVGSRRLAKRNSPPSAAEAMLALTLAFACAYCLLVLASLSLGDASTPLDDRILSPLLVLGVVGVLVGCSTITTRTSRVRWLIVGAVVGLSLLTVLRGAAKVVELRQDGQGYAGRAWSASQVIAWVADLDPGTAVYSNEMDALYLLAGRQAYQVPIRWDPVQAAPRDDYAEQLTAMQARVRSGVAVLVLFNTLAGQQAFLPSEGELADGLRVVQRSTDGVIYGAP